MRASVAIGISVLVAAVAFLFGRALAPGKASRVAPCPEAPRCPDPGTARTPTLPEATSAPAGTPLRACLEQVARLDRSLKAAARCAADGGAPGLSDNQARAMLAVLAAKERQAVESIVEAELRGRAEAAASARRTQGETIGAALADHVGLGDADLARVKALVCPLREAQERLRVQLTRSEIAPDEYFQLLSAERADTEAALVTALGDDRYGKLRTAAGLATFPCQ